MIHARRDIPIDRPHFVAWLILAHLLEVHSLPFEDAVVLARHRFVHEPQRSQLNLPDFFENLLRDHRLSLNTSSPPAHHGTGSSSKIFWMIVSLVFSSASASYVIAIRWRRTSIPMLFTS